jgi:hypothetical protein
MKCTPLCVVVHMKFGSCVYGGILYRHMIFTSSTAMSYTYKLLTFNVLGMHAVCLARL